MCHWMVNDTLKYNISQICWSWCPIYSISIPQCKFLGSETDTFCQFLDPDNFRIAHFCSNWLYMFIMKSYIIQSMFKLFFSIGGTRNWGNVSVSRPRNRPISSVSGARILTITGARNWQNVSVSGPRNCSNGQHSFWPKKLMLWVCFRGQKLGFCARDTLWCPKTSLVHSPSPGEDWSANDIPRGHMPNRCLLQTCPSLAMGNVILSRSLYIYFKSKKNLSLKTRFFRSYWDLRWNCYICERMDLHNQSLARKQFLNTKKSVQPMGVLVPNLGTLDCVGHPPINISAKSPSNISPHPPEVIWNVSEKSPNNLFGGGGRFCY